MKPNRIIGLFTVLIIVTVALTYNSCRIKKDTTVDCVRGGEGGTPCPGIPTVEYRNQTYKTVLIGDQCWLQENLNVGKMIPGGQLMADNDSIEKYCYDDNEANCETFGGLYGWYELMQYITQQGAQGLCPDGWHIPTDEEWTILTEFLGGSGIAGGKMKSTRCWNDNRNGSNSSGFTALPGGFRFTQGDNFVYLTYNASFWSSSESSDFSRWYLGVNADNNAVVRSGRSNLYGLSARCLKDLVRLDTRKRPENKPGQH